MRSAVAWVGLGLIAGALVWAVVTLALYAGYEDTGVEENALVAVMMSCLLGLVVLGFGAKWRAEPLDSDPDLRGPGCAAPVLIVGAFAGALVVFAYPEGVEGLSRAAPEQIHVWLITVAVTLGVLLLVPLTARPSVAPFARSFSAFVSGTLAVLLAGTLVHTVLYPEVRNTTAGEPGEPAAVPDTVTRVGWSWEPGPGAYLRGIEDGTHGPLMVLSDGVVSLDGIDGSELWSFRRPYDLGVGVAVDGDRVVVTHVPADRSAGAQAEVLDAATGEHVPGLEEIPHASSDGLTGHHVARTVDQVFRVETGDVVEDDTVLSAVEAATGEDQWSAPVPAGGGRVCEGRSTELRHDLLISTHVCEEEETFEGDSVGWSEDPDVVPEVEHVTTATDPDTGEQVWERTWDGVGDQSAWQIVPAGPVSEGADPVLLVEEPSGRDGAVLDPATGDDAITLPSDLADEDIHFEGFIGADSQSAVYLVDRRGGGPGAVFERVDPEGEVIASVDTGDYRFASWKGGTAALDGMVLTSGSNSIDGPDQPMVVVHEFGEDTVSGSDPSILLDETAVPDAAVVFRPVPGAVMAEVGYEDTVYGLVP